MPKHADGGILSIFEEAVWATLPEDMSKRTVHPFNQYHATYKEFTYET